MTQSTNTRVDNIYKLLQGFALALIILFLTRFISTVDSLKDTVNILNTEVKVGQSQLMDKLINLEKSQNNQDSRLDNLETIYWHRKTEIDIAKAKAKGRERALKNTK